MSEMSTKCNGGHNISQLAAKLLTWAVHMENKSEPDYSLGFTVFRYIQFDAQGHITVPEHVKHET
jgi:hypothetical protein